MTVIIIRTINDFHLPKKFISGISLTFKIFSFFLYKQSHVASKNHYKRKVARRIHSLSLLLIYTEVHRISVFQEGIDFLNIFFFFL